MGKKQKPVRLKKQLSRPLDKQVIRKRAEAAPSDVAKEPLPSAKGAEENKETTEAPAPGEASPPAQKVENTPNPYLAFPAVYALLFLYSLPILAFFFYLIEIRADNAKIDFEASIPRIVVALNIDAVSKGATKASNLLNDLHKVILPLITFISGILIVTTSQRQKHLRLFLFVFGLLAITFVTYLLYLPLEYGFLKGVPAPANAPATVQPANAAAPGQNEYSSISFLFSRTFESLIAYLTLLLGLSIATKQESEDDADSATSETKKPSADSEATEDSTPGGK